MSEQLTCASDICEHPDEPTYRATALCHRCYRQLERDLATINRLYPDYWASRDQWLLYRPTGDGHIRVKRTGSPAPGNINIISVTDPAGDTFQAVFGWACDLAQTDRALDVVQACRMLISRIDEIACHPALNPMVEELHHAAEAIGSIPDEHHNTREQDDAPRRVRRCTNTDVDGTACGGDMRWRTGTLVIVCGRCHHTEQIDGYAKVGTVCAAFNVSRSTLYRWVTIGWVDKIGREVCIDDVRAAVRRKGQVDSPTAVGQTV